MTTKAERERRLRELRAKQKGERLPGVEVVGVNVAKPARKWKVKRSSSSKGIEIVYEEEEAK